MFEASALPSLRLLNTPPEEEPKQHEAGNDAPEREGFRQALQAVLEVHAQDRANRRDGQCHCSDKVQAMGLLRDALTEIGLVKELTGQKRNRLYSYPRYLDVLNEGTEPIR